MLLIVANGAALGRAALAAALLTTAATYFPVFRYLMHSPLLQSTRVTQMKGILKANICGGSICLLLLVAAICSR
jgi:hypothetical protein